MNTLASNPRRPLWWLAGAWLLLCQAPCRADIFHYDNLLVGDRASGMGGAYTAVSDDTAGLYYNPAGVVYATSPSLSASANAYYQTDKTYKGGLGGTSDWNRSSSKILPNFFGILYPMGKGVAGFSYVVPDSAAEDQNQEFSNPSSSISDFVINFNNEDNTFNMGPSYAMKLSDSLSIGGTLYFHYRKRQWALNQLVQYTAGTYQWFNTYFNTTEYGVRPMLGLMWSPTDKVSVGLNLNQTFIVDSQSKRQTTFDDNGSLTRTVITSNEKRRLPLAVKFGAAYFPTHRFIVSADVSYYSQANDAFFNRNSVINVALGTEYYLTDTVAVRAGAYSNAANSPKLQSGLTAQAEHVDLYGMSASITRFARNSSLSLGASYSFGSGQAQVIDGSTDIQALDVSNLAVFLSTSYAY